MFPASSSNQTTYLHFCTLGGLANPNCRKVMHQNGTHIYFTYHLVSVA